MTEDRLPYGKPFRYRNPKILAAARGEQCTMWSIWCNGNPETTVAAHSNAQADGKGMGIKAHDCFVAFLCSDCHRWYDESGDPGAWKEDAFDSAMKRTWLRLLEMGVLK